jgi:hypothetical protein
MKASAAARIKNLFIAFGFCSLKDREYFLKNAIFVRRNKLFAL